MTSQALQSSLLGPQVLTDGIIDLDEEIKHDASIIADDGILDGSVGLQKGCVKISGDCKQVK